MTLGAQLARAGISPNAISLASIGFAAFGAAAFVGTIFAIRPDVDALLFVLAIIGIQGRLLCNMLDGMVAVEGGKRTPTGELFNEVPDRVADTLILVAAGYAGDPRWGPTLGWLAALMAMFTAYVRTIGKATTGGSYFQGPMAKPHRMFILTLACATAIVFAVFTANSTNGHDAVDRWIHRSPCILPFALGFICLGCLVTLWRRLSRIGADLRARNPGL